jgi:hypothetical protein
MRSRKPWVFARRRLFGWKVRLLITILQLKNFGNLVGVEDDFFVAADSKQDNLLNLGQNGSLGQVFSRFFERNIPRIFSSIFGSSSARCQLSKNIWRDTPFRFAFNERSSQEFCSLTFAQANLSVENLSTGCPQGE